MTSTVDKENLDLRVWVDADKYKGLRREKSGSIFLMRFGRNSKERLIDEVDKTY